MLQAYALTLAALGGQGFDLSASEGRITSLRATADPLKTDFIAAGAGLGDVRLWTQREGKWMRQEAIDVVPMGELGRRWKAGPLAVESRFEVKDGAILWRVQVRNPTTQPVVLGGLSTPLPMRTRAADNKKPAVLKHSFISGAGSFAFWMRLDSREPYLTMTPLAGTAPEYWNRGEGHQYQVFLHSASEAPVIAARKGSWRLPQTARTIRPGETAEYGYRFQWARDYAGVRDILARNGKLDVQIAPGMTVPSDLFADVALRSSVPVETLTAEHPNDTEIRPIGERSGYRLYRLRFRRLGENRITVTQRGGAKTYLEFFACQPVETLIKKRAAFLIRTQQRGTGKWYEGLLSEWNMESQTLLSPDNYDRIKGWRIYEVTCDDPGLGKPGFLASKNAEYPVQGEVTALDDYIEKFVWGGLQQTRDEKYPYGIYGIPDWKQNRESRNPDRTKGVEHLWRPYDYPHIALMYTGMYRIAKQHPQIRTRLDTKEYLRRAYGTANAMFTVPMAITKWSAYETGFYNEVVIPSLIEDLRREGWKTEARTLERHWEQKVKTFVAGKVDLFGSEYAFDSTGFESTQALADYAIQHRGRLGLTAAQTTRFLETQMKANLFCRGVVEPAYYYLGSDYRGGAGDAYTLSYMSQMGGSGVLRYGLAYAKDPAPYLRSGYQSLLSAWALMNAGTAKSNYGYWYPGAANDGGAGGGFEPASFGETWLGQLHGRGSWYYSCEIDLGFSGALRGARTIVADDPIFGRFCFGGTGEARGSIYRFTPRDGVRRRVSIRLQRLTTDLELDGARIDPSAPAELDLSRRQLRLRLEPTGGSATVSVSSARRVTLNGRPLARAGDRYVLGTAPRASRLVIQL